MKDITIEGHTEDVVKAACDGYFGLADSRGIYSCVNKDGSGIVCGGITDKEKNSCHTFQLEPDSAILKTILRHPSAHEVRRRSLNLKATNVVSLLAGTEFAVAVDLHPDALKGATSGRPLGCVGLHQF